MKVVVRLAIVITALLLVSNMAFALTSTDCTGDQVVCYNVTVSYPDETAFSFIYKFCLNNDGTGNLCFPPSACVDYLKAYGGGPGWFNFSGDPQYGENPNWSIWVANLTFSGFSGIYQPIGEGYLLTGVETYPGASGARGIAKGIKVQCPSLP